MKIAIASDHAGYGLKQELGEWLRRAGHEVRDWGPEAEAAVDYPDFARPAARAVAQGEAERAVLVCGTGIGMAMAANKVAGARAANVYDTVSARLSREHNDANIITLGARLLTASQASALLAQWLETPFLAGRHQARVDKIEAGPGARR